MRGRGRARTAPFLVAGLLGTSVGSAEAAVTISAGADTLSEAAGSAAFTLTRTNSALSTAPVDVELEIRGGEAACPDDLGVAGSTPCRMTVRVPGSVLGADTTATATVPIVDDQLLELPEQATVAVVGPPAEARPGNEASVTLIDDDDDVVPSIAIGDAAAVPEGDAPGSALRFPVTLSTASGRPTSVAYDLSGTAAKGADFLADEASLTIPAGATSAVLTLPIAAEDVDEPDEDVIVTLSEPDGATLADGGAAARGTITNDDLPALRIADVVLPEGSTGLRTAFPFEVTLSNPSTRTIAVTAATGDLQAKAGLDFDGTSQRLTFPPGTMTQGLSVSVAADTTPEGAEAFSVTLSDPVGATLGVAGALGGIVDDDKAVQAAGGVPVLPAVPGSGAVGAKLRLSRLSYRRSARTVVGTLACPAAGGGCSGRLTLFSVPVRRSKVKALRKELKLGSVTFKIAAGASKAVKVKLAKKHLASIRRGRQVSVKGFVISRNPAGEVATADARGVVKP